jgi:hypothetical protein
MDTLVSGSPITSKALPRSHPGNICVHLCLSVDDPICVYPPFIGVVLIALA